MQPTASSKTMRLLRLTAISGLIVLCCSCSLFSKQTKQEQDISVPPSPKAAPIVVNIPPPYPELNTDATGKIDPKEIEKAFILGGQVYNACVIELVSVIEQAKACANDPE